MTAQESQPSLSAQIEDHALSPVPLAERTSGWALVSNTAGIATTLVQISIAAGVSIIAGVPWGILAGVVVALFGGVLGWLVGHVSFVSGTSSTVTARFYGLGRQGSALASLIFAFMILGFLALENALLYYGTLFLFGWRPNLGNAIAIYGVLTIIWVLLTWFGMKVVQRTSMVLLIAFVGLTVALAIVAVANSPLSLGHILSAGPIDGPGHTVSNVVKVISILAGSAGALALVDADHARYARTTRDVGILAVGGSIAIDVVVVVLGAVIVGASGHAAAGYLQHHAAAAASQVGATIPEKIGWMISNNTGAYFIILFGAAGFVCLYAAQVKAQVLNVYSGSLTISNLVESVTGRNPGRIFGVILGNVVGLIFIALNILGFIASFLGILGASTVALATLIIADYFIVRRRRPALGSESEAVNWAGLISLVLGAGTGAVLYQTGVTPLGFLVSLVIVLLTYPFLRLQVFPAPGGRAAAEESPLPVDVLN